MKKELVMTLSILGLVSVANAADQAPAVPAAEGSEVSFEQLDKNGDGKLSKDEVPEAMLEKFDAHDKDGDGFLTKEELMVEEAPAEAPAAGG